MVTPGRRYVRHRLGDEVVLVAVEGGRKPPHTYDFYALALSFLAGAFLAVACMVAAVVGV